MRKRIKARVREPKNIPLQFALEVWREGKIITNYEKQINRLSLEKVRVYRYQGKLYYIVGTCGFLWGPIISKCIEL